MFKVGVVGLGQWGRLLADRSKFVFELAWTCDRSNVGYDDIPHFNKIEDVQDVDAVIIATQTKEHYSVAKYFLEKGVDVFLEKPMTSDVSQAEELVEIAKKNNKTLFVDNIFLYLKSFEALKRELEGKTITKINSRRENTTRRENYEDPLSVLNYHDVYLAQSLLGDRIFSLKHNLNLTEDTSLLNLTGDVGVEIVGSYVSTKKTREFKVHTKEGLYLWDQLEGILYKNTSIIETDITEPVMSVLRSFNSKIGKSDNSTISLSLDAIKLINKWKANDL